MAKNAIKILENEETLELFKDNAKKVAAKFDIENVVPFYEAIYEKALEVKV
jgi:glycosyltransferase involved in cell wall biosynthesis